jgi:hypothetical protein
VNQYRTVFEVDYWSNGLLADLLINGTIGVSALLIGVGGFILAARKPQLRSWGYGLACVFAVVWGAGWLFMLRLPDTFGHINDLVAALRDRRYSVVEGKVEILHEQPANGHTRGDEIRVEGVTFEVNHFYATPAYRRTIAHGGALVRGAVVRISHVNREIVRIEEKR